MISDQDILLVKALSGESDDNLVLAFLTLAGNKICRRAFPFDHSITEVPEQYKHLQIEGAIYLLNRRGAEGQTSHSENGISRVYESADLPATLLSEIIPYCGVVS